MAFIAHRALLGTAAALALVGLPGAASAKTRPAAAPATPAVPAIPRQADGHPDLSGIWQVSGEADYDLEPHAGRRDAPPGPGVVELGAIPYTAEGLAQRQRNFAARAKDDPRLKCWVLGVPRGVTYPAPFQIFQRPADLTLVHQFGNQVRTIHTDGSLHPDQDEQDFWLGDSRARWEGDTLVVDVAQFNDETWLDRAGNHHSEKLHVTERWRLIDANTIAYSATLEDPKVYTRPWTLNVLLNRRREPGFRLIEDYCYTLEYDPFYPHKEGQ